MSSVGLMEVVVVILYQVPYHKYFVYVAYLHWQLDPTTTCLQSSPEIRQKSSSLRMCRPVMTENTVALQAHSLSLSPQILKWLVSKTLPGENVGVDKITTMATQRRLGTDLRSASCKHGE